MKPLFTALLYVFVSAILLAVPPVALAADDDEEGDADAEGGDSEGGDGDAEEPYVEPDAWERPPAEEEKPKEEKKKKADDSDAPAGDGRRFQVGLTLTWGFPVEKADEFPDDAWNFGAGLRTGYTFTPGVYGGLMYSYFLGSEDRGASATFAQLIAAEAGYDWWLADTVIVRPSVDLGAVIVEGPDVAGNSSTIVVGGFYFGPGLVVIVPIDMLYTGGELRHAVVTSNLQSTTMITAFFGARL